jgi:hypothetical protein
LSFFDYPFTFLLTFFSQLASLPVLCLFSLLPLLPLYGSG